MLIIGMPQEMQISMWPHRKFQRQRGETVWNCKACGIENRDNREFCWNCRAGRYSDATIASPSTQDQIHKLAGPAELAENDRIPQDMMSLEYVKFLTERVTHLETQLSELQQKTKQHAQDLRGLKKRRPVPRSNVFSESFMTRAFAIYGHDLVVHFIISIPLLCLIILINLSM